MDKFWEMLFRILMGEKYTYVSPHLRKGTIYWQNGSLHYRRPTVVNGYFKRQHQ